MKCATFFRKLRTFHLPQGTNDKIQKPDGTDANKVKPADQEDERLLRLVATGDSAAFATLHRRRYAHTYRFALKIVQAPDQAEEVTNDTMVTVWSSALRFEFRSKVSTWIFGIAYRKALKSLRKNRWERNQMGIDEIAEVADTKAPDIEAFFEKKRIAQGLARLPAELKAVLELTYYYGFSQQEIGKIMSCPVGTVKSRMHAARAKMREILE